MSHETDRVCGGEPRLQRTRLARAHRRLRGITLLEVLIGVAVLIVALLGYAQSLVAGIRSQTLTHEQGLATEAARRVLEEMQQVSFVNVFRQYNATAADDLGGVAAPGSGFAVAGLDAAPGDADGLPGEVLFPTRANTPGVLREDIVDTDLGTPRDMDLLNGIDVNDHAGDYKLLPVVVRVRWRNRTGATEVRLRTILANLP